MTDLTIFILFVIAVIVGGIVKYGFKNFIRDNIEICIDIYIDAMGGKFKRNNWHWHTSLGYVGGFLLFALLLLTGTLDGTPLYFQLFVLWISSVGVPFIWEVIQAVFSPEPIKNKIGNLKTWGDIYVTGVFINLGGLTAKLVL